MSQEKNNKAIIYWLLSGCFLIFLMVVIGGITRLTHSGLSMVEWKLIMGALPPLNESEWLLTFEKYKQFPEYQLVNYHFTLAEFKSIFWWEYIHRALGRLIGLVFLFPFIYFLIRRRLKKGLIKRLLILFFLGGLQGFFGWYMVKSGLNKNPDVSHYRLAIHLITAFITFAYTFWVALTLIYSEKENTDHPKIRYYLKVFFTILLLQIVYGAFVAGLNAGMVYNTFPKMGDRWVAEAVTAMSPFYSNFIEGIAGVQFVHRYFAYVLVILGGIIFMVSKKNQLQHAQRKAINFIAIMLLIQFGLGILTLLLSVPIAMGVLHQVGAFFLFAGSIYGMHRFSIK